jgi:hypothetical protein
MTVAELIDALTPYRPSEEVLIKGPIRIVGVRQVDGADNFGKEPVLLIPQRRGRPLKWGLQRRVALKGNVSQQ